MALQGKRQRERDLHPLALRMRAPASDRLSRDALHGCGDLRPAPSWQPPALCPSCLQHLLPRTPPCLLQQTKKRGERSELSGHRGSTSHPTPGDPAFGCPGWSRADPRAQPRRKEKILPGAGLKRTLLQMLILDSPPVDYRQRDTRSA